MRDRSWTEGSRSHVSTTVRCLLLAVLVFAFLPLLAATETNVDLLNDIPVVDENVVDNAACGVAAATMILDYYLQQTEPIRKALDIRAVAKYVKHDRRGTSGEELQLGIVQASTAPDLAMGVPLTATWSTTVLDTWFDTLRSELDSKRPVIVFLPDGGRLWKDAWHYPHFVVVSGYTSDRDIIYHDPWDGRAHTATSALFEAAWGGSWQANPPWWYLSISAAGTLTPVRTATYASPSGTPTRMPSATFAASLGPAGTSTRILSATPSATRLPSSTPTRPPSPTSSATPSPTSTPTRFPSPTSTATRTPTSPPPAPSSYYVDIGNASSESNFALEGWGGVEGPGQNPYTSPTGDRTKRFQLLRADSSVSFPRVDLGRSYRLVTEVEDGGCTDNFRILANGVLTYQFTGQRAGGVVRVHSFTIPGNVLNSARLRVTFRNTSTDDCGLAAVFNLRIERLE